MPQTQHLSSTAYAFARTLLELATETSSEVSIGEELGAIGQIIRDNPVFATFLGDPLVAPEEREAKVKAIFGGRVSSLVLNTLGVLNRQGKLSSLADTCAAYRLLLDEKQGKIEVDVTVATKLTDGELEEVRRLVGTALKKNPVVRQSVDPAIIGGLVLRVGDKMIDGSVKTQLSQIRQKLLLSRGK